MNKYAVDYDSLDDALKDKPKVFKRADVEDRLVSVAFDVVRFVDGDDLSGLWQINQTDDGEYIVAQYTDFKLETEKVASSWNAYKDNRSDSIHLFYENTPVTKISLASFGIPKDEAHLVVDMLPSALATNKQLVDGLLMELSPEERSELLNNHPELKD